MIGNKNIQRGLMAVLMAVTMVSHWPDAVMKRMLTMLRTVATALICEATSRPMSAESSCTTVGP